MPLFLSNPDMSKKRERGDAPEAADLLQRPETRINTGYRMLPPNEYPEVSEDVLQMLAQMIQRGDSAFPVHPFPFQR